VAATVLLGATVLAGVPTVEMLRDWFWPLTPRSLGWGPILAMILVFAAGARTVARGRAVLLAVTTLALAGRRDRGAPGPGGIGGGAPGLGGRGADRRGSRVGRALLRGFGAVRARDAAPGSGGVPGVGAPDRRVGRVGRQEPPALRVGGARRFVGLDRGVRVVLAAAGDPARGGGSGAGGDGRARLGRGVGAAARAPARGCGDRAARCGGVGAGARGLRNRGAVAARDGLARGLEGVGSGARSRARGRSAGHRGVWMVDGARAGDPRDLRDRPTKPRRVDGAGARGDGGCPGPDQPNEGRDGAAVVVPGARVRARRGRHRARHAGEVRGARGDAGLGGGAQGGAGFLFGPEAGVRSPEVGARTGEAGERRVQGGGGRAGARRDRGP
jgi:hypothetical protein